MKRMLFLTLSLTAVVATAQAEKKAASKPQTGASDSKSVKRAGEPDSNASAADQGEKKAKLTIEDIKKFETWQGNTLVNAMVFDQNLAVVQAEIEQKLGFGLGMDLTKDNWQLYSFQATCRKIATAYLGKQCDLETANTGLSQHCELNYKKKCPPMTKANAAKYCQKGPPDPPKKEDGAAPR